MQNRFRHLLLVGIVLFGASVGVPTQGLAQFTQQGPKLFGTGGVDSSSAIEQGTSVALSSDGTTAIVGGPYDNSWTGAAWVFTSSGGVWTQQGSKLIGSGVIGPGAQLGTSVALSGDGNTAIVGGQADNGGIGAAWVFTRSGGVWTQQGSKLVAISSPGMAEIARQGHSIALSADGNTAILGGPGNNVGAGAAWVFTRSGGVWTQQSKLVGNGAAGSANQGTSVALSGDGNTAIMGGTQDNYPLGAAWVFTNSGGVWTQQGSKLVGTGTVGAAIQGASVALSTDGNTAVVGGPADNSDTGAAWIFTRSGGVWTQQGSKLVGTGAAGGAPQQGTSVALSGDGNTAIVGGPIDTQQGSQYPTGAAWVFTQPPAAILQVSPATNIAASGRQGGPFSPTSFRYRLSSTSGSVNYSISGIPSWLNASFTSGTATTSPVTVTFSLIVDSLPPDTYTANIAFTDTSSGNGNTIIRTATLKVNPKLFKITVEASPTADGTVSGGGTFSEGSSHTVMAMAASGHTFVHWTERGKVVSTAESYTFSLNANTTLVAHFK